MGSADGSPRRRFRAGLLCALSLLVLALACSPAHAAGRRSCASYPAPGQLAARGSSLPSAIARNYRLFATRRTANDRLNLRSLPTPLQASGIITAAIRYLGRTRGGVKLYAIPARHYTPYEIAPLRCFAAQERPVERKLLPALRKDYTHPAICIAETGLSAVDGTPLENCGPPQSIATAMVATDGLPLVGLAPNSVRVIQATYLSSPARTVRVHHNFYAISGGPDAVTPCGVTWLQNSGNMAAPIFHGCDYETSELPEYRAYRSFVSSQFTVVQSDLAALASAIGSGDLQNAQSAWLTAHLAWLLLGQDDKQYGAFGELGNSIDGTSAGLAEGEASPDFTGFHKIELDLWGGDDLSAAAADTSTLQQLVNRLVAARLASELPNTAQGVANWLLRPHEILEDAERDTLTSGDDYGSGTGAASIAADVSAVREDLHLLAPTLTPLAPRLLAKARAELRAVTKAANACYVNGHWTAIAELGTRQREQLNATVGAALETLARIPDLLTSTGPAAPPT